METKFTSKKCHLSIEDKLSKQSRYYRIQDNENQQSTRNNELAVKEMLTILSINSLTNMSKSSGLELSVLFVVVELPDLDTSMADEWTGEEVDGGFLDESVLPVIVPNQSFLWILARS